MTFERFYSIIRPHKAASFNTFKRAQITIVCIILFSILFDVPHVFMTLKVGKNCIPYGYGDSFSNQFYYWLSLVVNFFLPFVLLLIMNSVIIHTLRKRPLKSVTLTVKESEGYNQGEGHCQGHGEEKDDGKVNKKAQSRNTDRQIYLTLLIVTFGFLTLMTPSYVLYVFIIFYDFSNSASSLAGYHLFLNLTRIRYYTNYGINFIFDVISGQKFRNDCMKLFLCGKRNDPKNVSIETKSTDLS